MAINESEGQLGAPLPKGFERINGARYQAGFMAYPAARDESSRTERVVMPDTAPLYLVSFSDTITLTNSPLAVREILGQTSWRLKIDLSGASRIRLTLNVQTIGATNSDIHLEGSPDGATWTDLTPEIAIGTTGAKDTGWTIIPLNLRIDNVFVRMMEKDGDGVADPIIRQILIHVK